MHGSPELLEFYLVEATEYVDALDQVVGSGASVPDGNVFIATARALRGSSTMAKVEEIAELSLLLERIAHGGRDGEIAWTPALHEALRGTVDDLRFLVRGVRTWGAREDARAAARLADLGRFVPLAGERSHTPTALETTPVFIALQASAIAAELDAYVANSANRRALDDALSRTRTLRGIAGIADFPPLPEVADLIDQVGRRRMPDAPLAEDEAELFRSAAAVLRRSSEALRSAGTGVAGSEEVAWFARAARAVRPDAAPRERIVGIDELYFADEGPHLVSRGPNPALSRERRFREESAVRAEHLQRLVVDASQATDATTRERVDHDLRHALQDLAELGTSFGMHQVAAFFGDAGREPEVLARPLLRVIAAGAASLLQPGASPEDTERHLAVLERSRRATPVLNASIEPAASAPERRWEGEAASGDRPASGIDRPDAGVDRPHPTGVTPPSTGRATPPGPHVTPGAPRPRRAVATPTGRELQALLGAGIAAFKPLDDEPLSPPAQLESEEIVPIETLLYRGESALLRAIAVRDEMRTRGVSDDAAVEEIFDLLDLARAE